MTDKSEKAEGELFTGPLCVPSTHSDFLFHLRSLIIAIKKILVVSIISLMHWLWLSVLTIAQIKG
jgi:hypothetical protein